MNKKYFLYLVTCVTIGIALFSTCKKDIPVTGVKLNTPQELTIATGDTLQLIATIYPKNATNKNVTWTSSNAAVATVTDKGKITALTEGNAIITITTQDGNFTANCNLNVVKERIPVTGVTLNKNTLSLDIGETETLIATIEPDNATNKNVTWTSSRPTVATVSSDGTVTAVAYGKATITASADKGNKKATCSVSVDYRAKWVGSYDCEEEYSWWTMPDNSGTALYQTVVDVNAVGDSTLRFLEHRGGKSYDAKVNSTGEFIKGKMHSSDYGVKGNFIGDSLDMIIIPGHGLGWSASSTYKGKKLKNN